MGFFVLHYVPKMIRVMWLGQVLSHPLSCCSLGVWDFLSNVFLKSGRQGMCSRRGVQPDTRSWAPAPSPEDERRLWSGCWPAT